jgi:hypothetical protein
MDSCGRCMKKVMLLMENFLDNLLRLIFDCYLNEFTFYWNIKDSVDEVLMFLVYIFKTIVRGRLSMQSSSVCLAPNLQVHASSIFHQAISLRVNQTEASGAAICRATE